MEHWYMKGKQKQAQGLIEILRERKREERMNSMLERVRTTQDAMERIHWEQKTGTYPEHRRREQEQRSGSGVKESMSGYEEPREGPKFLRCSISDVVNEIKSEKDLKQKILEEKREMARRKKEEQVAREIQENEAIVKAKKPMHIVRTIDSLGTDDDPRAQGKSILNKKASALGEKAPAQDDKTKTNVEHVIFQACRALSKSAV